MQTNHNLNIDRKFNRLTIVSILKIGKYINYNCRCDCGNNKISPSFSVISGKIKSCGCLYLETRLNRASNKPRKDIKPGGMSGFNYYFSTYRRNARLRGYEFLLTKEEFYSLTKGNCDYCDSEPENRIKYHGDKKSEPYICNGIDRMDNNAGYLMGNCVSCCSICNRAKGTLSYTDFKKWIFRLKNSKRALHV